LLRRAAQVSAQPAQSQWRQDLQPDPQRLINNPLRNKLRSG